MFFTLLNTIIITDIYTVCYYKNKSLYKNVKISACFVFSLEID